MSVLSLMDAARCLAYVSVWGSGHCAWGDSLACF